MRTILVVEDTDDLREVYLEVINGAGYRAFGAANGQEALQLLESIGEQPCLILLDLMMPVMDGGTFLRVLRESHRLAALPIVVMSACEGELKEPARRIVKKPISLPLFMNLLTEYCGQPTS